MDGEEIRNCLDLMDRHRERFERLGVFDRDKVPRVPRAKAHDPSRDSSHDSSREEIRIKAIEDRLRKRGVVT